MTLAHATDLIDGDTRSRRFILDLDGTLIRGDEVLPGARALIDVLEGRFVIASNNSTHSRAELSAVLRRSGLAVPADRLVLAGETAVEIVAREHPGTRVLLVGSSSLKRQATALGLHLTDERADLVLLARDIGFDYARLTAAANAIRDGADLVVTNPDLSHPGPGGSIVPETGSLLRALLACATPGRVRVIGKPEPWLFTAAMRRLDAAPGDCVFVGDNPTTDATGADRLGIPFLLVSAAPAPGSCRVEALADRLRRQAAETGAAKRP